MRKVNSTLILDQEEPQLQVVQVTTTTTEIKEDLKEHTPNNHLVSTKREHKTIIRPHPPETIKSFQDQGLQEGEVLQEVPL